MKGDVTIVTLQQTEGINGRLRFASLEAGKGDLSSLLREP